MSNINISNKIKLLNNLYYDENSISSEESIQDESISETRSLPDNSRGVLFKSHHNYETKNLSIPEEKKIDFDCNIIGDDGNTIHMDYNTTISSDNEIIASPLKSENKSNAKTNVEKSVQINYLIYNSSDDDNDILKNEDVTCSNIPTTPFWSEDNDVNKESYSIEEPNEKRKKYTGQKHTYYDSPITQNARMNILTEDVTTKAPTSLMFTINKKVIYQLYQIVLTFSISLTRYKY